jgi:hypothetical protein
MRLTFLADFALADKNFASSKINIVPFDVTSFADPRSCREQKNCKSSNVGSLAVRLEGIDPLQGDGLLDLGIDLEPLHSQRRA